MFKSTIYIGIMKVIKAKIANLEARHRAGVKAIRERAEAEEQELEKSLINEVTKIFQ